MVDMSTRYEPGDYQIGIYRVVREGRSWVAYGTSWGRAHEVLRRRSLDDCHLALTGERRHD